MTRPASATSIDRIMDQASLALEATRYFEAERLCKKALLKAHHALDFERMARIALPLQEARRQKRQLAVDAAFLGHAAPGLHLVDHRRNIPEPVPGCYLFQPPLIGADARHFRDLADAAETPALVLCREPLTRDGLWPIVAVGSISLRTKIPPPFRVQRVESAPCKDGTTAADAPRISREWVEAAAEALGDAALARLPAADPAAWIVEDLLDALDAHPDHERLHQALADACRRAALEPAPDRPRRRPIADDPFGF